MSMCLTSVRFTDRESKASQVVGLPLTSLRERMGERAQTNCIVISASAGFAREWVARDRPIQTLSVMFFGRPHPRHNITVSPRIPVTPTDEHHQYDHCITSDQRRKREQL